MGTNRKDGWPRISPCEVDLTAGHLFLGMMWRSMKALDLRRDPRAIKARIDWAPDEPWFHLFSLDVAWASLVAFGDAQTITRWDPSQGLRRHVRQLP